jgi:hypothetical protein
MNAARKKTASHRTATREKPAPGPQAPRPGEPPSTGIEHGEVDRAGDDELVGTASSHTPRRDVRAEEPAGEIAPSADTEGGID